jgi:mRNA interferase MazF
MRRGEVWWARLPLPAGRRPVVLVSRGDAYAVRQKVTVAEVSTVVRAIPSEVALGRSDGMPKPCVINTDNLVTIPKALLESKIVSLDAERVGELERALAFSLGLDDG